MKIFLDIGAHIGQSLVTAMQPKYGFDRLYAFEPSLEACEMMKFVINDDPRVVVCPFALWDSSGEKLLYLPFGKGASLYYRQAKHYKPPASEMVLVQRASEWFFAALSAEDEVYAKFNCEGAEVPIVNDLIDRGAFAAIHRALIRLDSLKLEETRAAGEALRARLQPYVDSGIVTTTERAPGRIPQHLEQWLDKVAT